MSAFLHPEKYPGLFDMSLKSQSKDVSVGTSFQQKERVPCQKCYFMQHLHLLNTEVVVDSQAVPGQREDWELVLEVGPALPDALLPPTPASTPQDA